MRAGPRVLRGTLSPGPPGGVARSLSSGQAPAEQAGIGVFGGQAESCPLYRSRLRRLGWRGHASPTGTSNGRQPGQEAKLLPNRRGSVSPPYSTAGLRWDGDGPRAGGVLPSLQELPPAAGLAWVR